MVVPLSKTIKTYAEIIIIKLSDSRGSRCFSVDKLFYSMSECEDRMTQINYSSVLYEYLSIVVLCIGQIVVIITVRTKNLFPNGG